MSLCDKMGFLVMNETFDTWTASKNNGENGYNLYFKDWRERDTRDLALRDRNHPSVIIYSVGNEIRDNLDIPEGFKNIKINKI
jgi:beta-galactosidase